MPRPQTKDALLLAASQQYAKLWALMDDFTPAEQDAAFCFDISEKDKEAHWRRDKNLRDVLVHLYEWHQLLLNWVSANRGGGEVVPFLPAPYNWKTYSGMNLAFWEKYQGTSLADAKTMLQRSHQEVLALAEGFTNDELFEQAHFAWGGQTKLGSYFISATSSHYDWAMKKLKRQLRALRQ